jgi:hypothetical protein
VHLRRYRRRKGGSPAQSHIAITVSVMVEIDVLSNLQRVAVEITSSGLSLNCTSQSWLLVISNISTGGTDVYDCSRNLLEWPFERPSHLSHRHPRCPSGEGEPRPYKGKSIRFRRLMLPSSPRRCPFNTTDFTLQFPFNIQTRNIFPKIFFAPKQRYR